jgi:hypothetical protein
MHGILAAALPCLLKPASRAVDQVSSLADVSQRFKRLIDQLVVLEKPVWHRQQASSLRPSKDAAHVL